MITLEQVKKDLEVATKAYGDAFTVVQIYDEEETRGLVHTDAYNTDMKFLKNQLPILMKARDDAWEQLTAISPPYDPDNHISGCGCVIQDGRRAVWCGDHF